MPYWRIRGYRSLTSQMRCDQHPRGQMRALTNATVADVGRSVPQCPKMAENRRRGPRRADLCRITPGGAEKPGGGRRKAELYRSAPVYTRAIVANLVKEPSMQHL